MLHSARAALAVPSVVRLTRFVRVPYRADRAADPQGGVRAGTAAAASTAARRRPAWTTSCRAAAAARTAGTTSCRPAGAATTSRPTGPSPSWAGACAAAPVAPTGAAWRVVGARRLDPGGCPYLAGLPRLDGAEPAWRSRPDPTGSTVRRMGQLHDLTALEQAAAVRAGEVSAPRARRALRRADRPARRPARRLHHAHPRRRPGAGRRGRCPRPAAPASRSAIKDLNLTAGVPTRFGSRGLRGLRARRSSDHVVDSCATPARSASARPRPRSSACPATPRPTSAADPQPVGPVPVGRRLQRRRRRRRRRRAAAARAGLGRRRVAAHPGQRQRPGRPQGRRAAGSAAARSRRHHRPAANGPLGRTVARRRRAARRDGRADAGRPALGAAAGRAVPRGLRRGPRPAARRPLPGRRAAGREVHPHVVAAYEEASALLGELGHEVEDVDAAVRPPSCCRRSGAVVGQRGRRARSPGARGRAAPADPLAARARPRPSAPQFTARRPTAAGRRPAGHHGDRARTTSLLLPTLAQPPAPVGWFSDAGDPAAEFDADVAWTPFTALFNATGQPAISLPLHDLAGRPADRRHARRAARPTRRRCWRCRRSWSRPGPGRDRHPPLWA